MNPHTRQRRREQSFFRRNVRSSYKQIGIICDCAAQSGVTVYMHNHNHGATPSTGDQVLKMLNRINSPALSYVLDTGQFQGSPGASGKGNSTKIADNQLYESIEICASKAKIVRAKFYFDNDIEEQWLDYQRIVQILKSTNFDGAYINRV
ncbi:MAG: hypothetical protein CL791_05285 [Chloroflexi bacterium]|nr:hypothetical protein [Chloroflexota bacterium]